MILVGAISIGETIIPDGEAMVDIVHTLSISTRGSEEGFAIPLSLTQPRLCCPMGLRHWDSLCGFAHVNSTHHSGLLSLTILVFVAETG